MSDAYLSVGVGLLVKNLPVGGQARNKGGRCRTQFCDHFDPSDLVKKVVRGDGSNFRPCFSLEFSSLAICFLHLPFSVLLLGQN